MAYYEMTLVNDGVTTSFPFGDEALDEWGAELSRGRVITDLKVSNTEGRMTITYDETADVWTVRVLGEIAMTLGPVRLTR